MTWQRALAALGVAPPVHAALHAALVAALVAVGCGGTTYDAFPPPPPDPEPPLTVISENLPTAPPPAQPPATALEAATSPSTEHGADAEPEDAPLASAGAEANPAVAAPSAPERAADPFRSDEVDGNVTGDHLVQRILTMPAQDPPSSDEPAKANQPAK